MARVPIALAALALAALSGLSALVAPASAGAATKSVAVADPADAPPGAIDLVQVRASYDEVLGRVAVTFRARAPLPARPGDALAFFLGPTEPVVGGPPECDPDLRLLAVDGDLATGQTDWGLTIGQDLIADGTVGPSFSRDRREATITIADPNLRYRGLVCLIGASALSAGDDGANLLDGLDDAELVLPAPGATRPKRRRRARHTRPARVRLRASRHQAFRARSVTVSARCPRRCTVRARATVKVGRRFVAASAVRRRRLPARRSVRLRLRFDRQAAAAIAHELHRRRVVWARVAVRELGRGVKSRIVVLRAAR